MRLFTQKLDGRKRHSKSNQTACYARMKSCDANPFLLLSLCTLSYLGVYKETERETQQPKKPKIAYLDAVAQHLLPFDGSVLCFRRLYGLKVHLST